MQKWNAPVFEELEINETACTGRTHRPGCGGYYPSRPTYPTRPSYPTWPSCPTNPTEPPVTTSEVQGDGTELLS